MRRAALVAFLLGIGIFCFDQPSAWARGFGGGRGGGGFGGGGFGGSGGGFGHVPTASRSFGEYRAPAYTAPRETYHAAPAYRPGPVAHYESHAEPFHGY